MSGIVIDVQSGAPQATKDVEKLSSTIDRAIRSALNLKPALTVDSKPVVDLKRQVEELTRQVQTLGRAGQGSTQSLTKGAAQATNGMQKLVTAAKVATAAFIAFKAQSSLHRVTDELTNINNRLALIADTSEEVLRKQRQAYAISKEARSEFAGTADLMVNFTRSLGELGVAEGRINRIVTTIQKSGTLSGTSMEGLRGALIQLNQGISSGTLRGEELNSVMEQMGYLGIGLQRALGMNAGQLRKFAEEGRLTSEVLVKTLEGLSAQTDSDFSKTAATVDQASKRVGSAVKYLVADVNQFYGISAGFATRLMSFADNVDSVNSTLLSAAEASRQSVKNMMEEFRTQSAIDLTIKAAMTLDYGPMELYEKYRAYTRAKEIVDMVQGHLDTLNTFKVAVRSRITGEEDSSDIMASVRSSERLAMANETISLAVEAARISWEHFVWSLPHLATPVRTVQSRLESFGRSISFSATQMSVYSAMPAIRQLEGLSDALGFYISNDSQLERAWTRMFRVRSLKEFNEAFRELNSARDAGRLDDEAFWVREGTREIREFLSGVTDVGIALGLLENRMLRLRVGESFDRVTYILETYRRVFARLYSDVLYPKLAPPVQEMVQNGLAYAEAFGAGVRNFFTFDNGFEIGVELARGLKVAIKGAIDLAAKPLELVIDEGTIGRSGQRFARVLKDSIVGVGKFTVGFFKGFFEELFVGVDLEQTELFDSLATSARKASSYVSSAFGALRSAFADLGNMDIDISLSGLNGAEAYLSDMYQRIRRVAERGLAMTLGVVKDFARAVKREFFEIYDDVVGHSTWPDLIDGVNAYTEKLRDSEGFISRFAARVKDTFARIGEGFDDGPLSRLVYSVQTKLEAIDWSAVAHSLRVNAGAALVSAIMLAFGGVTMKIAAGHFFISLFNTTFGDVLSVIAPGIGAIAGEAFGRAGALIRESLETTVGELSKGIMPFLMGFAGELGGVVSLFTSIVAAIPNALVWAFDAGHVAGAMIALFAGYALLAKNGAEKVLEMVTGTAAAKGKEAQMGFLDAFLLGTPIQRSQNGNGLLSQLFREKYIAIGAGVAFATSFLDGISLAQASVFGIPLLVTALLGRDGATRVRDSIAGALRGALATTADFLRSYSGGALGQALSAGAGGASVKRAANKAGFSLLEALQGSLQNFMSNRAAFGRGEIDFWPMFNTGQTKNLRNYFAMQSKAVNIGGRSLADIMANLRRDMARESARLGDVLHNRGAKAAFVDLGATIRDNIGSALQGLLLMTDSVMGGIVRLLHRYRGLVIGVIALLFTGLATAGVTIESAFSETLSVTGSLMTNLGVVAGLVSAIAVGMKMAMSYSRAYKEAMQAAFTPEMEAAARSKARGSEDMRMAAVAAQAEAKRIKRLEEIRNEMAAMESRLFAQAAAGMPESEARKFASRQAAEFGAAQIAEADRIAAETLRVERTAAEKRVQMYVESARKEAQAAAGAHASGWAAVRGVAINTATGIRDAMSNAWSFAFNPQFRASALSAGVNRIRDSINRIPPVTTAAMASIAALNLSFMQFRAGQIAAGFQAVGMAIKQMTLALMSSVVALRSFNLASLVAGLKMLPAMLSSISGLLWTIVKAAAAAASSLAAMLGIPLALIGAVAGIGAVGIALFGPGNGFFDRLQWAYDKTRDLFGLQPSTTAGKSMFLNDEFKSQQIGDLNADFSGALAWLDYEKMSTAQVEVLRELAKTNADGFKRLEGEFIKNGKLSAEQRDEFKTMRDNTLAILSRQPAVADRTLGGVYSATQKDFLTVDQSLASQLKRLFNVTPAAGGFETDDDTSKWIYELRMQVTNLAYDLRDWAESLSVVQSVLEAVQRITEAFREVVQFVVDAYRGMEFVNKFLVGIMTAAGVVIGTLLAPVLGVTAGVAALVGAMTGLVAGGYLSKFADFVNDVIKTLRTRMLGAPTEEQKKRSARFAKSSEKVLKYQDELPQEVRDLLTRTRREAAMSRSKADQLVSQGFTGRNFKSMFDYNAAVAQAEVDAKNKEQFMLTLDETYGNFAEENYNIRKFKDSMDGLTKDAKKFLDLNLGDIGDQFLGRTAEYAQLTKLIERAKVASFRVSRSQSVEEARRYQAEIDALQEQAKLLTEQAMASMKIDLSLNMQATAINLDRNAIEAALSLDPEVFFKTQEYTAKIRELQASLTELGTYDGDPVMFAKIRKEILATQAEARSLIKTAMNFESISAGLSDMGVQGFDMKAMVVSNRNDLSAMMAGIDAYKAKRDQLNVMVASNAPFEEQIKALREMLGLVNSVQASLKRSTASAVKDVMASEGSELSKALQIEQITGQEVPAAALKSGKIAGDYNKLVLAKVDAEAIMSEAAATGEVISDASAQVIARSRLATKRFNESLTKMAEERKVSIENLISSLAGVGVEITTSQLVQLPAAVQQSFVGVAAQIEAVNHKISELGAGSVSSGVLKQLVNRQQQLIEQAANQARSITVFTGEQISAQLEGLGTDSLHRFSASSVKMLAGMSRELAALKAANKRVFDTSSESDIQAYLSSVKQLAKQTMALRQAAENASAGFAENLGEINKMFGTSLAEVDFARFNEASMLALAEFARNLRHQIEVAMADGTGDLRGLLEQADMAKLLGAQISMIAEYRSNMMSATVEGAKAGFERLRDYAKDLSLDVDVFRDMDGATRRKLSKAALQVSALEEAMELPAMTQEMVDALKGLNSGVPLERVLADFTGALNAGPLASPTERLIGALENLRASIDGSPIGANGGGPKSASGEVVDVPPDLYRALQAQSQMMSSQLIASVKAMSSQSELLMRTMPGLTAAGAIGASSADRAEASALYDRRQSLRESLPGLSGEDRVRAMAEIEGIDSALEYLIRSLNDAAEGIREAGRDMVTNTKTDMKSALSGLFKGEKDGDRGIFSTFAHRMLDSVTNSMLETFSQTAVDSLFKGTFKSVFESLGSSAAGAATGLFSEGGLLTKAFSWIGDLFKGGGGGIFSSIMGIFGFADGGKVSGPGTSRSDSIPARLSNGEFVVNAKQTSRHLSLLQAINSGASLALADGGLVDTAVLTAPARYDRVSAGSTSGSTVNQEINLNITGDISRQTRTEIYKMLPTIAAGVNRENRESSYRK